MGGFAVPRQNEGGKAASPRLPGGIDGGVAGPALKTEADFKILTACPPLNPESEEGLGVEAQLSKLDGHARI